jgi:hypothetical protein
LKALRAQTANRNICSDYKFNITTMDQERDNDQETMKRKRADNPDNDFGDADMDEGL